MKKGLKNINENITEADFWIFDSKNSFTKNIFDEGTAKNIYKTLEGKGNENLRDSNKCQGCSNAIKLENCINVRNSIDCINVRDSKYCHKCSDSEVLIDCYSMIESKNCINCSNSTSLEFCQDCSHSIDLKSSKGCTYSARLQNCTNCHFCYNLTGVTGFEHQPDVYMPNPPNQRINPSELPIKFYFYNGEIYGSIGIDDFFGKLDEMKEYVSEVYDDYQETYVWFLDQFAKIEKMWM